MLEEAEMIGVRDAAEEIERKAWSDLVEESGVHDARVCRPGRALALVCPTIDGLLLNRALGVGLGELDAVLAEYRNAGIERFLVHGLSTYPPEELERRGLARYHRSWIKVARSGALGPAETPPCPFEIATARPDDARAAGRLFGNAFDAEAAAPLFARAFARERWHAYVARDGGRVVAAGLLFVADGVGYLAAAATDPDHRRRGAQSALLAARIRRAVELGCRVIFSETGERVTGERNSSYDNMLRQGFRPIYRRANWTPKGITWSRSVA
jgi:GNAT superfamily N-acetyltransferase